MQLNDTMTENKTLIGEGHVFIFWPTSFFQMKFRLINLNETRGPENEYMNMPPPPTF